MRRRRLPIAELDAFRWLGLHALVWRCMYCDIWDWAMNTYYLCDSLTLSSRQWSFCRYDHNMHLEVLWVVITATLNDVLMMGYDHSTTT